MGTYESAAPYASAPVARAVPPVGRLVARARSPFTLAGIALGLVVASQLIDFGAAGLRIRILDSATEWSWSHIAATAGFATATVAACYGARRAVPQRFYWAATAAGFGLLFLDNISRLHTAIPHWPVLYAPVLLGLAVGVFRLTATTDELIVVTCGLTALFLSLAIHVLGPPVVHALGWGDGSWAYQVKVALKKGTELAGWVLLVPAMVRLARRPPGK